MPSSNAKPCVLAIDDEPELLELLRTALEQEGYDVLTASAPEDGLKLYEQHWHKIGLVLLDYLMPGLTGDLVFECIQRINPDARVLLLTACDDHVARALFERGLRGYIQKPFYLSDLSQRVAEEINSL